MEKTQQASGKLYLRYVGHNGQHTQLTVNGETVASGYNCNKSIMLLLWCACDMQYKTTDYYIDCDFDYRETTLGTRLCNTLFKPALFSKYDIMMDSMATANAYKDVIYKANYDDPISVVLSARRDVFLHVQKVFKLTSLEVIYELNEEEVYAYGKSTRV